ncbi:MAG: hypothetical protein U0T60_00350 [Buchnera aphidicola (Meitanaphis microgallis)]
MEHDVIFNMKKDNMISEIKKVPTVCVHDWEMDYYTIYKTKRSLIEICDLFSNQVSLDLLDVINVEFNLEFDSIKLEKYNEYNNCHIHSKFLSYCTIMPYSETGIVHLSDNIIPSIIDILFGGKSVTETTKCCVYRLTIVETNILKKILNIVKKIYSVSWKKKFDIDVRLSDFKLIQKFHIKHIVSNSNIFLFMNFKVNFGNILGFLNIGFPLSIIKNCRDKLANKCTRDNLVKKKSKRLLWPMIYNLEINLDIKLVSFSLLLSQMLMLRIGDIISIHLPKNAIAYSRNAPILVGEYRIYEKKSCFFLKNFFKSKHNGY